MAKYSKKIGGKEVGDASVYAEPHTMTGKKAPIQEAGIGDNKKYLRDANVSVAYSHSNDYPATKTSGIKIRGTGAATKGITARGPMA
tara:strand:+ start:179 stop:439 length:261 start_codon:yes stop_codon:yes gene_type:complete